MHKRGFFMRKNAEQRTKSDRIKAIVTSLLAFIGAVSLCLLIFGEIAVKIDLSDGIFSVMAQLSLCAGCFAAAYTVSKQKRRKGLIIGLYCGSIVFIGTFLLGIIFSKGFSAGGVIIKLLTVFSCSAIGGVLGVNSKKRFR